MTVICKVYLGDVRKFGEDMLVKTQCVADQEVMAMYNKDDEDKLFTQASPTGSADFLTSSALFDEYTRLNTPSQNKFYLVFVKETNKPLFSKAIGFAPVRVNSCTDFGGTSKQFEIGTYYGSEARADQEFKNNVHYIKKFNHRILIDNPGASNQLKAGDSGWWVGIYNAGEYSMQETLIDAHQ